MKYKKLLIGFFVAMYVLSTSSVVRAQVDINQTFYVPGATQCTTINTQPTANTIINKIYVIGDSLTDGMRAELTTAFGTKLAGSIEATVGINIKDSIPKVSFTSDTDTALVGLGTNDFYENATTFKKNVSDMVTALRKINPNITIYWTNIYAPRADVAAASDTLNAALRDMTTNDSKFKVIDWKSEALSGGYTYPSDQLHPNEHQKRADFIVKSLGISITQAGQTPQAAASGSYSAKVYGATATLPAEWIPILQKAAARFSIDPSVLAGLLSVETAWKPPAAFATYSGRNGASATGPFQFVDETATSYMPAPDSLTAIKDPAKYTSGTIKAILGTDKESDGSYVVDGNKDGKVDRVTPEDAAFMGAAFMKALGATTNNPLGTAGDYSVPHNARGDQLTVRLLGAYFNQGPAWSAPNAKSAVEVNALAKGGNDVAFYMDQMMEVTDAGRKSGVYGLVYSNSNATCDTGSALIPGAGGWDLKGEGDHPMVYYSQLKSGSDKAIEAYAGNDPYGKGTIFECGCGPTSMAMIVSTLTTKKVTPAEMAKWASDNNYQTPGCGSDWFWTEAKTQTTYGIKVTAISGPQKIADSLKAGHLVIMTVGHFPLPSSPDQGHISVIRKYADGNFYLADPYAEGWKDLKDVSRHPYSEADLASIVSQAWDVSAQ